MLRTLLINPQEHRPRAFWRLLLHGIFYFGFSIFTQVLLIIAAGFFTSLQGSTLQNRAALDSVINDPLINVLSALSALIILVISILLASRWLDRRPLREYGFHLSRRWAADFLFGLFLGAFLMTLIFLIELSAGWITISGFLQSFQPGMSFLGVTLVFLVVFFCVGLEEELLVRGYELRNLAEGLNLPFLNARTALLLAYSGSSIFFGLLHLANPNASLTSTLYLMGAGLLLGLGYVLTGELAVSIGLHMAWNFFQGCVYGFPVSGLVPAAAVIAVKQGGPLAWTGGSFGPEAGLLHPLAVLLGCLLIAAWVRISRGRINWQQRLAVYRPSQG